jgi:MFS family permease
MILHVSHGTGRISVAEDGAAAGIVQRDDPPHSSLAGLLRDHRDFRLLWLGTLATMGGQWVLQVALGWLVLDLTDSEFWVGLVGFAGGLPILLASIPAGVLIDRAERRRILLLCQGLLCVLGAGLALLVASGAAEAWHLLAGSFLNGLLMTVNNTARQTIVPATVPRADLGPAVALTSAGQNATRVVGPSLAGAIIGFSSVAGALGFQAIVLGLALLLTFGLSARAGSSTASAAAARGGLLDGLTHCWERPVLRDLLILATIPTLTVFPYIQLLPVYARDILDIGPQGLGLLLASSGSGAVVGALMVANTGRLRRMGPFLLITTIVYCLVIVAFAVSSTVWLSVPLLVLAGVTGAAFFSLNNTLLQLHVDDDIRGRVMGVYMLTYGLMPVGALPMGIVAGWVGAPAAVAGGAMLAAALVLLLALRSDALRTL